MIAALVNTKDRPTEVSLLLQSLRTQTCQDFDVFIMDDCGGTSLNTYHFFNCMITRLKLEGHKVFLKRNDFNYGVSRARQEIVNWALEGNYEYFLRVDDDVILESDYLERLLKVLENYDIASGVTIPMAVPIFKRNPKYLKGVINRIILDEQGNYIFNGDDCGMGYTESVILPAHHFRSCALIKRKVHEKVKYWPTRLTKHGFREEQIFSYRALMKGFKIGVDTQAVNYHQITMSGGERSPNSQQLIEQNQKILEEFTKENKDELNKYFSKKEELDKLELMKNTNLIM